MNMAEQTLPIPETAQARLLKPRLTAAAPALAAIAYPFLLAGFHALLPPPSGAAGEMALAALLLALAFAMPLSNLVLLRAQKGAPQDRLGLRARRLALAAMGAPPLFVLIGVGLGLLKIPLSDLTVWIALWLAAGLYVLLAPNGPAPRVGSAPIAKWRIAHGAAAAIIVCFVLFHLFNHLMGLDGPKLHAAVMAVGRKVYRAPFIEPLFVALLLFQIVAGIRLAWRWSALPLDPFRIFQLASGAYLAAFLLAHMNSALVSARAVHGIETNWAWASGAPTGLLRDAWNIRLVPHYALGAFFVLGHLASGARVVLLAHGAATAPVNRAWRIALVLAALIAATIMAGLCGVRL